MTILLADLLDRIPQDTHDRVDKKRKQIQATIREELRKETGFLLNRKDASDKGYKMQEGVSVPIDLVTGLPERLINFKFPDELLLALAISPFRREMEKIRDGIAGCEERQFKLPDVPKSTLLRQRWEKHVPPTGKLIGDLLKQVSRNDPLDMILGVNEDVLGVYRYLVPIQDALFGMPQHECKIELYWGVIGLIAGMLGVSVELLTTTVLIHELAHAYTHVGADIDGNRWDSRDFADTSTEIKEGLAQYYTHILSQRMDSQNRGLHEVYLLLLSHQPPAYHTHEKWINDYRPEEVRSAMISARRSGNGDLKYFTSELRAARKRLRSNA
jgi:hypothetical protein